MICIQKIMMELNTWIYLRVLQKQPLFNAYVSVFRRFCDQYKGQLRAQTDIHLQLKLFTELLRIQVPRLYEAQLQSVELLNQTAQEYVMMREYGVQACHYFDLFYPHSFDGIDDPPWTFSFLGCPTWNECIRVGIVGSREVHASTSHLFRSVMSPWLKNQNCSIVSGGARGVDQLAHQMALFHSKPTFAWMPSGLKNIYPQQFTRWLKDICVHGAVLSEFDFSQEVRKYHFQIRNRLISAMSDVLIIPQSSRKSGTMMTAHSALGYGKPLWVFPGHVLQDFMGGNLDLLQIGASLVTSVDDLSNLYSSEFKITTRDFTTDSVS
ncbi:MAG: DNA-processing protein DprA [Pseudobdellovibrionaceae bacterium]